MADPQILNTLRAKRERIEGLIAFYEAKVKEARTDLAHVNAVIRMYEIGDDPHLQFPAHMDVTRLFKRGEMVAVAKEGLQATAREMTTRELAAYVVEAKGWDAEDKALRSSVAYRLVQALSRQEKRGAIKSAGKRKGVRVWALS